MLRIKRRILFLTLGLCLVLASCRPSSAGPGPSPTPGGPTQTLDAAQFDALLAQQPLSVESASYVVQDSHYKALFPDMLQATVRNNTGGTVTKAVVAFAAWDINGNPVAIEAKYDFIRGFYIREVTFQDIQVPDGGTFGERYGFKVEEACRIARIKAIAVRCETSEGETWTNPCYDAWLQLYEGVGFSENQTVEAPLEWTEGTARPAPSPT